MVTAFLSVIAGRVAMLLSLAVITPVIVRLLGADQYGVYASLLSVFSLTMILCSAGINSGSRKFLSEERDREDWKSHVFGFYFRMALFLALIIAVGFWAAATFGLVDIVFPDKQLTPYFYLLALMVPLAQFSNYVRRSLMGLKLEHISEPIKISFTFIYAGVGILLAGPWLVDMGVAGVLLGRIVGFVVTIVLAFYFAAKHLDLSYIFKRTPSDFPSRKLIGFNNLSVVYMFLLTSLYHVDIIMLGMQVSKDQVGYYKAALVLAEFLWFGPQALQAVMVQSTSNLWTDGRIEKINEIASRVTRYGLLLTLLLAIGIGALANKFVPFYYPKDFQTAVLPLLLLLPGSLGFAIARPILSISQAKGDLKPLVAATGATAVLNLALNALLIPQYGILGAAVATTIGYGSLPLFQVLVARKLGFQPFGDARLLRIAVTGLVAAVPIVLLATTIQSTLLALVVVPPTGFVIYLVAAILTGAVELDEIFDILTSFPDPVGTKAGALHDRVSGSSTDETANRSSKRLYASIALVGAVLLTVGFTVALTGGVSFDPAKMGGDSAPAGPVTTQADGAGTTIPGLEETSKATKEAGDSSGTSGQTTSGKAGDGGGNDEGSAGGNNGGNQTDQTETTQGSATTPTETTNSDDGSSDDGSSDDGSSDDGGSDDDTSEQTTDQETTDSGTTTEETTTETTSTTTTTSQTTTTSTTTTATTTTETTTTTPTTSTTTTETTTTTASTTTSTTPTTTTTTSATTTTDTTTNSTTTA